MPLESEIKFEVALRDFIQNFFPKVDVDQSAISVLSKILKGFNNAFINEMLAYKNMPLLNAAQCAVEKKLPKSLKKLALAEAHRQLALYEMGYSEYDDVKEVEKEVAKSVGVKRSKRARDSKTSVKATAAKKLKLRLSTGSKRRKKSVRPKKTKKLIRLKVPKKQITSKASKPSKKSKKVKKEPSKKEQEEGSTYTYTETPTNVFKAGILKLHGLTHSTLKIEKDALGYFSACLYYFSKTMALKLAEKYPKMEIEPKFIKDVLAEFSGPNLHQSAVSEGIKSVTLFMNGLLPFKMGSLKIEPPIKGESFRSGLELFLEKEFYEPIRLDYDSSEYLEHLLIEFLKLFAEDAGEICLRQRIRVMSDKELRMVTEDILAEELRRHAMIRGEKAVADFQRGLQQYSKPDTTSGGMPSEVSEKKKNSLLNPKPKKRPKLEAKAGKATPTKSTTSQASNKNPKQKKPSKKIKSLVSKVLKKK